MKIKLEDIKRTADLYQWSLLSTEYKNLDTPLEFLCPEGHAAWIPYKQFRVKPKCPVCIANLKVKVKSAEAKPKTDAYRVLALDQSSHKTGYSVYDGQELIGHGVFETRKKESIERIEELCDWLQSMIILWKPDLVGMEDIQYNPNMPSNDSYSDGAVKNHNAFKLLGQVMGALIITILRNKCAVGVVLIATWRKYCGVKGNKRADQKRSAQMLVEKWHGIKVTDDESDAICIGKYFARDTRGEEKRGIGEF